MVMPRMCGSVARKPKLTPELATRMLFGPGVIPMDVMKGILVRINANGKDCISTSMESLAAKILALALAQRMAHARRTGSRRVGSGQRDRERGLLLVNASVNFIHIR